MRCTHIYMVWRYTRASWCHGTWVEADQCVWSSSDAQVEIGRGAWVLIKHWPQKDAMSRQKYSLQHICVAQEHWTSRDVYRLKRCWISCPLERARRIEICIIAYNQYIGVILLCWQTTGVRALEMGQYHVVKGIMYVWNIPLEKLLSSTIPILFLTAVAYTVPTL